MNDLFWISRVAMMSSVSVHLIYDVSNHVPASEQHIIIYEMFLQRLSKK